MKLFSKVLSLSAAISMSCMVMAADNPAQQEALALVNLPAPTFSAPAPMPSAQDFADLALEQPNAASSLKVTVRDGKTMQVNLYANEAATSSVLLLHGVSSSSYTFNVMAGKLREALNANVFAMDFRGHGQSEGKPGDVDYVNQYADDVEDVLQYIKKQYPQNKLVLAGHSMGGGIALIHAQLANSIKPDAYALFAPNLGATAPTVKKMDPNAAGEAFLKLHMARLVGLYQLNQMGNHDYDNLPVMFFNLPDGAGTNQYSYRAMLSTAPVDYDNALKQIDAPVITFVGSNDEAFDAQAYPNAMATLKHGEVKIIEGKSHNGIRQSDEAMQALTKWASQNGITG